MDFCPRLRALPCMERLRFSFPSLCFHLLSVIIQLKVLFVFHFSLSMCNAIRFGYFNRLFSDYFLSENLLYRNFFYLSMINFGASRF